MDKKDLTQLPSELTEPANGSLTEPATPRLIDLALNLNENPLPTDQMNAVNTLGKRSNDKKDINDLILKLFKWRPLKLSELAMLLERNEKHLLYTYVTPLKEEGKLQFTIPKFPNHPNQSYKTAE